MTQLKHEEFFGRAFALGIAATIVIAMAAPRFTGIAPPIIAVLSFFGYRYVFARWPRISKDLLFWSLLFPALMIATSALWSIDPPTSLDRAWRTFPVTLSGAVLFAVGMGLKDSAGVYFRRVFPLFVIAAAVICAIEIYFHAPIYHLTHDVAAEAKRFSPSRINRSVVVLILSSVIAFACLLREEFSDRNKKLFVAALGVLMLLIFLKTSSQSAQLAILVALFLYFTFPYERAQAWLTLGILLTAAVSAAPWIAIYMFTHWADPIAQSGMFASSYIPYRLEIWDFVSDRALQRPFFGHGVEATKTIKDFVSDKKYWRTTEVLHPHNFALQIWIEFGALGAAITAAFFGVILGRLRRMDVGLSRLLLPLFIACVSVGATGYGLWQTWWIGLFCLIFASVPFLIKREGRA